MNLLPLGVIVGFGKKTGAALENRFAASHQLLDLDNGFLSDDPIRVPIQAYLDRIVPWLPMNKVVEAKDHLVMSLTCRYMTWVDCIRVRTIPATTLVIYNPGHVNYDKPPREQVPLNLRFATACGALIQSFGVGMTPSVAQQLLWEHKFIKDYSESRFLVLAPSKTESLMLSRFPKSTLQSHTEALCYDLACRAKNFRLQVHASPFISSNLDKGGNKAENPEVFADRFYRLYRRQ